MTTVEKMRQYIGKTGSIQGDGTIRVTVEIKDAKSSYGVTRLLVSPITGSGEAWVNAVRVELDGEMQIGEPEIGRLASRESNLRDEGEGDE